MFVENNEAKLEHAYVNSAPAIRLAARAIASGEDYFEV